MKVFISQPMTGLTEDQILNTRNNAIDNIFAIYGKDIQILSSYHTEKYRKFVEDNLLDYDVKSWEVYWLSQSLVYLSEADLIWFVDGWQHSKGCTIEHLCASLYGIETEFETLATRRDGSYKYGEQ